MKITVENKARLAFALALLLIALGGLAWAAVSAGRHATYQIRTQDPVSGLIADAPVEFHGVEVGKVTRVELIDPHSVSILLSLRKEAPVTMATVATITARGLATRGFTGYVVVSLEDVGTTVVAAPDLRLSVEPYLELSKATLEAMPAGQKLLLVGVVVFPPDVPPALGWPGFPTTWATSLQQVTRTLAANNRQLDSIIVNTDRASRQLKPLLASSNDTVKALQTQVLPEAYKTLANMERLSNSLNAAATKINRDPAILVRGSTAPPGPGESK